MGRPRGRPRGSGRGRPREGVADRGSSEAPASVSVRVTRQTTKMMQCGSSTVAKGNLLGTDNVSSPLVDPSAVPPQNEVDNLRNEIELFVTSPLMGTMQTAVEELDVPPLMVTNAESIEYDAISSAMELDRQYLLPNSSIRPMRSSCHDAELELSDLSCPELCSENVNHGIPRVITHNQSHRSEAGPSTVQGSQVKPEVDPELCSENVNHGIPPVIMHNQSHGSEAGPSTVQGLPVKPEVAQLLQQIFAKYGDIAKDTNLRYPDVVSYFLEMTCSIIQKLRRSNFREITSFEVARMLRRIQDLEEVKFNVGWLRSKLEDIMEKKKLDIKYSGLEEEKVKIEKKNDLLESYEVELVALQDAVQSYRQEIEEMTDKYEEDCRNYAKMKVVLDAYEKDLLDGLL